MCRRLLEHARAGSVNERLKVDGAAVEGLRQARSVHADGAGDPELVHAAKPAVCEAADSWAEAKQRQEGPLGGGAQLGSATAMEEMAQRRREAANSSNQLAADKESWTQYAAWVRERHAGEWANEAEPNLEADAEEAISRAR